MARRSPFPGMDPWLESYWRDLHTRYIASAATQLNRLLPPGLIAAVEETTRVLDPHRDRGLLFPDVAVIERPRVPQGESMASSTAAVAAPVMLRAHPIAVPLRRVEIRSARGDALITVLEFISPANKLGRKNGVDYKVKRSEFHEVGVNVMEIDLLRVARPLVDVSGADIDSDPDLAAPYKCSIWRASDPDAIAYYPLHLRTRLPRVHVPLRESDQDVIFDLQEPVDLAYEEGRFLDRIDYAKPPTPRLSDADAAWAADQIDRWRRSGEASE